MDNIRIAPLTTLGQFKSMVNSFFINKINVKVQTVGSLVDKYSEQCEKYNTAVNHYNEVVLGCLNLDDDMKTSEENGCWVLEIEDHNFNHFCSLKFKIDDMYDQSKRLEKLSSLKENEYIKLLGEGNAAKLVQVISFELHKEVFRSKLYNIFKESNALFDDNNSSKPVLLYKWHCLMKKIQSDVDEMNKFMEENNIQEYFESAQVEKENIMALGDEGEQGNLIAGFLG